MIFVDNLPRSFLLAFIPSTTVPAPSGRVSVQALPMSLVHVPFPLIKITIDVIVGSSPVALVLDPTSFVTRPVGIPKCSLWLEKKKILKLKRHIYPFCPRNKYLLKSPRTFPNYSMDQIYLKSSHFKILLKLNKSSSLFWPLPN